MRTVISLNNDWLFDISPANLEPPFLFSPEKTQAICLPHTWNAEDGQSGENYRRACCAYYRALHVPAQANGRFYLEFQDRQHRVPRIFERQISGRASWWIFHFWFRHHRFLHARRCEA